MTGYFETFRQRHGVEVVSVNGSTLGAWTVEHLLDEHILPPERRALFRRMLANVSQPELCVNIGRELIDALLSALPAEGGFKASQRKRTLQALRGVRASLSALTLRGVAEDNVLAPYRLSEYAVLAVWAKLHGDLCGEESANAVEFGQLLGETMAIALRYHERLDLFYQTHDAFAYVLPHNLFLSKRVFEEAGRLGLQGCFWAWHSAISGRGVGLHWAYAHKLACLLKSHSGLQFPAFDHQATDIHHALLLLVITGYVEDAKGWVTALCQRLNIARSKRDLWPTIHSLDQQLQVRFSFEEPTESSNSCSTLIPILLTWTAVLGIDDGYRFLRENIIPSTTWSTPNFWSSDAGYDSLLADSRALHEHGVGEAISYVPEDPQAFLESMAKVLRDVEPIDSASWHKARYPFIPMLAALHWGVQLPRQMLVQQAVAFCEGGKVLARAGMPGSAAEHIGGQQTAA